MTSLGYFLFFAINGCPLFIGLVCLRICCFTYLSIQKPFTKHITLKQCLLHYNNASTEKMERKDTKNIPNYVQYH